MQEVDARNPDVKYTVIHINFYVSTIVYNQNIKILLGYKLKQRKNTKKITSI